MCIRFHTKSYFSSVWCKLSATKKLWRSLLGRSTLAILQACLKLLNFSVECVLSLQTGSLSPPSLFPLVSCFAMFAWCFFLDFRHERVLEGITICGEMREQERFSPIVQGIVMDDPNMKVRPWPFTLSITAWLYFMSLKSEKMERFNLFFFLLCF